MDRGEENRRRRMPPKGIVPEQVQQVPEIAERLVQAREAEPELFSQPIPVHTVSSSKTVVRIKRPATEESRASTRREELLSPMKRFDDAVMEELNRRREDPCKLPEGSSRRVLNLALEKNVSVRGLPTHASASTVQDLERELAPLQMNSALASAVDCLMKAEQAFYFHGAVRAAEAAAESVPPDQAEEAAAVGARFFKTEIVENIEENWEAPNPVEVVGYIGITKPL